MFLCWGLSGPETLVKKLLNKEREEQLVLREHWKRKSHVALTFFFFSISPIASVCLAMQLALRVHWLRVFCKIRKERSWSDFKIKMNWSINVPLLQNVWGILIVTKIEQNVHSSHLLFLQFWQRTALILIIESK